ncbi:ab195c7c-2234-4736-8338-d27a1946a31c [Sclerotinia trifoliorum]|uniref:Chromatin modification-related protein EAF3 n=1 Tax=Sclerotinia trifoliorum TaxID=28548 RepID=A0A8H2ZN09_9HELO|nr:ab195c7c-2234-4736-8338-d27a1946a31c [Sclerotinia trifoliorum]
MGSTTVPGLEPRARPLAKKSGNSIPALQDKTKEPQALNGQKKAKARVKGVNSVPVPTPGVRRSARERCPPKPYDRSIIDSGNLKITKLKPRMTGKNPDWANPKSGHWDIMKFLNDDSMVPKTNLDARPPKANFQFIVNNSIRNPETYRPDKFSYVHTPKQKLPPVHPKLQAHIKNGTDTMSLRQYYENYEPGQINPIAGRLFDDNKLPPARLKRKRLFPLSYDEAAITEIMKPVPKKIKLTLKKALSKPSPKKTHAKATGIKIKKKVHFAMGMTNNSEVRVHRIKTTKKMLPHIAKTNIVMAKRDFNYLQEESFHNRPSINLVIPDHIKAILVDDWENVTKNQQLVPLPHKKPVDQILNDWLEFEKPKRPVGSAQADILEEIVAGLKEYFERCLGRILLYRFERQQYTDFRQLWDSDECPQTCASDTYGAEHLCRLLVTLPELIAQTNMDLQSVNRLREELSKLTNWIGKNSKDYFVNEYETPGAEYVDKARSNN